MADELSRIVAALSDRYAIDREIGRGGMATVYLAEDLKHHRTVAIKVLHPDVAASLGRERFLREIEIVANLRHRGILPLYDSGEADGLLYYVMPYVEGPTLRDRLDREKQFAVEEALRITADLAAALDEAHGHGVIHRDVKPENVLFEGEQPLIADFGVATALEEAGGEKLTRTGVAVGTPAYMSPEQAAGGEADARSDEYALACVLYEMLGGIPPFTGPTPQAVMARHALDPVPDLATVRSTVPEGVIGAVEKAMAKVPADRYPSAGAFAEALERGDEKRRRAAGRRRRGWVAAGLLGAAAIMIVAYSTMVRPGGGDTPPASAPAYEPLPEARRALARARAAWLEGDALMADSLLGEARRLDPEYPAALAFEALQTTIYLHPDRRDPDPRPACELAEAFGPTAKQAAESALAADSTLVLPHVALGRVLWEAESSWAGGEAEFLRALELDPANPDANYWYGAFLLTAGRPEEAWAHFSRTIDENLSARRYVLPIGILAYKSGHLEEAEAVLRRAWILFNQEAWPATFLAANLRDQGRVEEAIEVLIEAGRDTVSEPLQGWQWAIAMGNGEAVDRHIAEAAAAGEYAMAATIAYRAGWDDVALQYLEAGWPGEVECPSIGRTWLLADFPRLADRPRFQEMMDVAGIPWRDSPLVGQLAEAEDG